MFKKALFVAAIISVSLLSGCASVPMASIEQDAAAKKFSQPATDKAGLYVFRNTFVGQALKKTVSLDGAVIGETANKIFFYKEITPGSHTLSTESEFSDNVITFQADGGKNYFAEQYIKMGVFVGGAGLVMVPEEEGKRKVLECGLAK
jgi:protein involved in sex pheromone biosynthesis